MTMMQLLVIAVLAPAAIILAICAAARVAPGTLLHAHLRPWHRRMTSRMTSSRSLTRLSAGLFYGTMVCYILALGCATLVLLYLVAWPVVIVYGIVRQLIWPTVSLVCVGWPTLAWATFRGQRTSVVYHLALGQRTLYWHRFGPDPREAELEARGQARRADGHWCIFVLTRNGRLAYCPRCHHALLLHARGVYPPPQFCCPLCGRTGPHAVTCSYCPPGALGEAAHACDASMCLACAMPVPDAAGHLDEDWMYRDYLCPQHARPLLVIVHPDDAPNLPESALSQETVPPWVRPLRLQLMQPTAPDTAPTPHPTA